MHPVESVASLSRDRGDRENRRVCYQRGLPRLVFGHVQLFGSLAQAQAPKKMLLWAGLGLGLVKIWLQAVIGLKLTRKCDLEAKFGGNILVWAGLQLCLDTQFLGSNILLKHPLFLTSSPPPGVAEANPGLLEERATKPLALHLKVDNIHMSTYCYTCTHLNIHLVSFH